MRARTRVVVLSSIALVGVACVDQSPLSPPAAASSTRAFVPNQPSFARAASSPADHVVIQTKGPESSAFTAAVAALGGKVERRFPQLDMVIVKGLTPAGAASLGGRSDVLHLTQDMKLRWLPATSLRRAASRVATSARPLPGIDQSSAFFYDDFQWNMKVTKANQAWLTTPEGREAKVYVLDTGIDPTHLDLAGRVDVAKSKSMVETEPDIFDHESHGTFVSAIITSNGIGVASVAPLATITAVKVLDATGSGSFADLIEGIVYAADNGADVINMSLGAIIDASDPSAQELLVHLSAAVLYARTRGVVVVAAAGNEALDLTAIPPQFLSIPAEIPGVIAVGATAPVNQMGFDQLASYSNFGWTGTPVGGVPLFAPGGDLVSGGVLEDLIISACSQFAPAFGCGQGEYLIGAGTSFSSPMVAGEGAVLRSIVGKSVTGSFTTNDCVLRGTDVIGPSSVFGRGRMNVVKAAACASARVPAASHTLGTLAAN